MVSACTLLTILAVAGTTASAQDCGAYTAALNAIGADAATTLLVDRTGMGVPRFAFAAYTDMTRGDTTLARVMGPLLRAANGARIAVPACLVDTLGWHTISDSLLLAFFLPPWSRWTGFRAAYPTTPKFVLLSQPVVSGDSVTFYLAIASDALAGSGHIVRVVRDRAGRWFKQSEVLLWVS